MAITCLFLKRLAQATREELLATPALVSSGRQLQVEVTDLKTYDPEDDLERDAASGPCVFLLSTASEGAAPPDAHWFAKYVCELGSEHRVSRRLLERMRFAVVGLGDSAYRYADVDLFCAFPRAVDAALCALSAQPLVPLHLIDQSDSRCTPFFAAATSSLKRTVIESAENLFTLISYSSVFLLYFAQTTHTIVHISKEKFVKSICHL